MNRVTGDQDVSFIPFPFASDDERFFKVIVDHELFRCFAVHLLGRQSIGIRNGVQHHRAETNRVGQVLAIHQFKVVAIGMVTSVDRSIEVSIQTENRNTL